MAQDKLPLTDEQRNLLHQKRVSFECSPFEIEILKALRSFTFGQLIVHLHNGIPLRYTFGSSHVVDPTKDQELMKEFFGDKYYYGKNPNENNKT